jgi:predicted phage-related endonuclease
MDLNSFMSPLELFALKTGVMESKPFDNNPMFMGRFFENRVLELWEHYDLDNPDWETTCHNIEIKKEKVREAFKPNIYAKNPKYPFLFGGPDGLFWHGDDLAVLEVKTISGQAARRYEDGIPPSYIAQIHGYMMLFDALYGEIAVLVESREFIVYRFERSDVLCDAINMTCKKFWKNVGKAKPLALQMKDLNVGSEYYALSAEFERLEPVGLPEHERAFNAYIDERYKYDPDNTPDHTTSTVYSVNMLQNWKEKKSLAESKVKHYSMKVKNYLKEAPKFSSDIGVKVTYSKSVNGGRTLRTKRIKDEG